MYIFFLNLLSLGEQKNIKLIAAMYAICITLISYFILLDPIVHAYQILCTNFVQNNTNGIKGYRVISPQSFIKIRPWRRDVSDIALNKVQNLLAIHKKSVYCLFTNIIKICFVVYRIFLNVFWLWSVLFMLGTNMSRCILQF